jgi:hypothetical protein
MALTPETGSRSRGRACVRRTLQWQLNIPFFHHHLGQCLCRYIFLDGSCFFVRPVVACWSLIVRSFGFRTGMPPLFPVAQCGY